MLLHALKLLWLSFFFLWAPSHTLAGTRDPDTPDSKYLEFGQQFRCVQQLRTVITEDDKDVYQFGSAVIIQPHWVLTAAHVVNETREPVLLMDGEQKFPLTTVFVHPEFKNRKFGFHDLALCYSPEDLGLEFYTPLYEDQDEVGKAVTIAGYGLAGTFHTGAQTADGKKRGGHNKIDGAASGILICTPSQAGKLPLEFCITPGDSGGGMFIGNKLAGINSFLMAADKQPNGTYTDEAAHTRISLYTPWIRAQMKSHELFILGRSTTGDPDVLLIQAENAE